MMDEDFMAAAEQISLKPEDICVIDQLAQETSHSVETVRRIYVVEISRLRSDARIQDYVIVLTRKKVRDTLREAAKLQT